MARVFDRPHWAGSAMSRLMVMAQPEKDAAQALISACGVDMELESEVAYSLGIVSEFDERIADFTYEFGIRKDPAKVSRLLSVAREMIPAILHGAAYTDVVHDSDAAIQLLGLYIEGKAMVTRERNDNWRRTEDTAKEAAMVGLIASFATPSLVPEEVTNVRAYNYLAFWQPTLCDILDVSETWEYAVSSSTARDHVRAVIAGTEVFDLDKLRIKEGTFARRHEKWVSYSFMGISVHHVGGRVYVMDNTVRAELHRVLHTAAFWFLYGANHRDPRAEAWCLEAVKYVGRSIAVRVAAGRRVDTLASQMKKSYSALLAHYKNAGPGSMDLKQFAELRKNAEAACEGEDPWIDVLLGFDEDIAVDIGTAWNMLPGVDAEPYVLARELNKKMEGTKDYVPEAWDDFLTYSAGVITAHILCKQRGDATDYRWNRKPREGEDVSWIDSCLAGALTYPPDGCDLRIERTLKWERTLEFWHYKAQDVVHVFADNSVYKSAMAARSVGVVDSNELLYCLKNGSALSGKYTPEEVRAAWQAGAPPGDRVLVTTVKRENTKPAEKARDTHSGDDVLRECISEGEGNIRRLARMLDGCTSGVTRGVLERMINRVISGVSDDDVLDSMDFDGWSPNAPRKPHMRFQDLLYSFFDVDVRPSAVFNEFKLVISKSGAHTAWVSRDGSIQGFFGTGDTILNSLMCQWAFHKEKVAGNFTPEAQVRKVTLIDDVLMNLSKFGGDVEKAVKSINARCALLGYKAEMVKTLMSTVKGHFLNRLYHKGQEVVTACKIFARADREHGRMFTTIWDRVDSCYGSFLGASDRGADPVACYVIATCRAMACMHQVNNRLSVGDALSSIINSYMPRALGGWGLPSFAQWVTRESTRTVHAGLSVIAVMAEILVDEDPQFSAALCTMLREVSREIPAERSVLAFIDDPFNITFDRVVDPGVALNKLYRKALDRGVKAAEFRRLMAVRNSQEYQKAVELLLHNCDYPAAVVAEFAASLPHAVINGMFATAESNEAILYYTSAKERSSARRDLNDLNRKATMGMANVLRGMPVDEHKLVTATYVLEELQKRARQLDGYRVHDTVIPGVLDSVRQAQGEGTIRVHIPALGKHNMFNGVPNGGVVRTAVSAPIVEIAGVDDTMADPVYRAYRRMAAVSAVVRSYGSDPRPLEVLWSRAWLGADFLVRTPDVMAVGTNPFRLAQRVAKRNHSVYAWPNAVRTVVVDASRAIEQFEEQGIKVPFMTVVYVLKAAALLDAQLGGTNAERVTRHYNFARLDGMLAKRDYPRDLPSIDYPKFEPALPPGLAAILVEKIGVATFEQPDEIHEEHPYLVDPEVVKKFDVLAVSRFRNVGVVPSFSKRVLGAFGTMAEAARYLRSRADVPAPLKRKSRSEVIAEATRDEFEARMFGLVLDIAVCDPQDERLARLVPRAEAAIREHAKWLRDRDAYDDLRDFAKTGNNHHLRKKAMAEEVEAPGYHTEMRARYEAQSKDSQRPAWLRFKYHYMAHVEGAIDSAGVRKPDVVARVTHIAQGFDSATGAILSRTGVDVTVVRREMSAYVTADALGAIKTKGALAAGFVRVLEKCYPPDFSSRGEILKGARLAAIDCESYLVEDVLKPALAAAAVVIGPASAPTRGFALPQQLESGGLLLAGTDAIRVIDEAEWKEFLRRAGMFDMPFSEEFSEDFKAFTDARKKRNDVA